MLSFVYLYLLLLVEINLSYLILSYYVYDQCKLYNYADDNTISSHSTNVNCVINNIENASDMCVNWFEHNMMKANPDKFQAIFFGKESHLINSIKIGDSEITPTDTIKLLGVTIDDKLNYNEHINQICSKAIRQLNILARLSKKLCRDGRLNIYKIGISAQSKFDVLGYLLALNYYFSVPLIFYAR